jgi:Glycosyltransferase
MPLLSPVLKRRLDEKFARVAENQAFLVESVTNIETAKAMAVEPALQTRWEKQLAAYVQSGFKARQIANWGSESIQLVSKLSSAIILYIGAKRVMDADMTVGDLDVQMLARSRSSHLLLSLEACDFGISPTNWQKSVHPKPFHQKIEVIFDGIDTDRASPADNVQLTTGDLTLRSGEEVLTYVARNLEPYRGFRTFMHALPKILERRPSARIVVVGGNGVSYGSKPKGFKSWRDAMLAEVHLDTSRVHFIERLAYDDLLTLFRISRAHVYLTYPFVLSWSCLEAMACGTLVIGSDTPPVREVIEHGKNGLLTDFFDADALAEQAIDALARPNRYDALKREARKTMIERYDVHKCVRDQLTFIANFR